MKAKRGLTCLEESAKLKEFQERLFDLKQDEETLHRFLKYTDYNLSHAETMIRKSINWRKENSVDSYLHWKNIPKPVADDYKFKCLGKDEKGHAVIYLPIGQWQTKKIMDLGYKEETFLFRFHLLEKIMEYVRRTQQSKFVMIMDMEGLTYRKCIHFETIQLLSQALKDFELNYPMRLRACYIINAPWAFTYIYNILKQVLSSRTLNKAKIFDTQREHWEKFLMESIPKNQLDKILK